MLELYFCQVILPCYLHHPSPETLHCHAWGYEKAFILVVDIITIFGYGSEQSKVSASLIG